MITLTREEAQQVLDALYSMNGTEFLCQAAHHPKKDMHKSGEVCPVAERYTEARETLRARLSAPEPPCKTGSQCIGGKCPQCVVSEPEPVAWMNESDMGRTDWKVWAHGKPTATMPLYAAPPKFEPSVEPVAWHEPGAYGNVTVYQKWAEENGWLPLYTAPSQKNV